MKRSLVLFILLVFTALGVYAIEPSYGFGGFVDYSNGNGVEFNLLNILSVDAHINNLNFGGYAFIDITYAEFAVSFGYGMVSEKMQIIEMGSITTNEKYDYNVFQMGFSVLLKYPINMGKLVFFPAAGVSYNMILKAWDDQYTYNNMDEYNQFGVLAGAGFDYDMGANAYFRTTALFHLRFANSLMSDFSKATGIDTTFGLGGQIRLGVGFKF